MPSRSELAQVRKALDQLVKAATGDLDAVWRSLRTSDRMLVSKALTEGWLEIIEHYGDMAATIAADLFEVQAYDLGIQPKLDIAPGVDPDRASSRLNWALRQAGQWGAALGLLDELVRQPYRSTMQRSAWRSGGAWARVPTRPHPCAFCTTLASRGAVYRSEQIAKIGFSGEKYHGDCGCEPVLVRGPSDYPEGYDPEALYDVYEAGRAKADSGDPHAILAEMRRLQNSH